MSTLNAEIRGFFSKRMPIQELSDDDDLFSNGFNSLYVLELFDFLDAHLGVKVEDADLEFDNFRSVNAVATFVRRKRGEGEE